MVGRIKSYNYIDFIEKLIIDKEKVEIHYYYKRVIRQITGNLYKSLA